MVIVQESLPNFHASAIEQAVKRALPIWNTTGLVDMKGLDGAIETMRRLVAKCLNFLLLLQFQSLVVLFANLEKTLFECHHYVYWFLGQVCMYSLSYRTAKVVK